MHVGGTNLTNEGGATIERNQNCYNSCVRLCGGGKKFFFLFFQWENGV